MRVVQGTLVESRYSLCTQTNTLIPKEDGVAAASAPTVIYIDDNIGLHKVANPSPTQIAASLHLYSPPFTRCSIWLDAAQPANQPLRPVVTYHSAYGALVDNDPYSSACCGAGPDGKAAGVGSSGSAVRSISQCTEIPPASSLALLMLQTNGPAEAPAVPFLLEAPEDRNHPFFAPTQRSAADGSPTLRNDRESATASTPTSVDADGDAGSSGGRTAGTAITFGLHAE
jgi:hypothetical protein